MGNRKSTAVVGVTTESIGDIDQQKKINLIKLRKENNYNHELRTIFDSQYVKYYGCFDDNQRQRVKKIFSELTTFDIFKFQPTVEKNRTFYGVFDVLALNRLDDILMQYITSDHFDRSSLQSCINSCFTYKYLDLAKLLVKKYPDENLSACMLHICHNDLSLEYLKIIPVNQCKYMDLGVVLRFACNYNYHEFIKTIPIDRCTISFDYSSGQTELMYAVRQKDFELIKQIVDLIVKDKQEKYGGAFAFGNYDSYTQGPFDLACYQENIPVVSLLIENLHYKRDFLEKAYKSYSKKVREIIIKHIDLPDLGFLVEKYGPGILQDKSINQCAP